MTTINAKKFVLKQDDGYIAGDYVPTQMYSYMADFAKQCVIEELEKHIEHPTKPGYKRHDILNRLKELRNESN